MFLMRFIEILTIAGISLSLTWKKPRSFMKEKKRYLTLQFYYGKLFWSISLLAIFFNTASDMCYII